ncbi:MAG: hypothetical protein AAF321_06535 [Pseudomonadota bacterium]
MPRYPETPDGRYFVASHVFWRKSDPRLPEEERQSHVRELMSARRAVRDASNEAEEKAARARVHAAKVALGERGPVWWEDGAPDYTRRAPKNTPYAAWWAALEGQDE